jgi:hypothetical protein
VYLDLMPFFGQAIPNHLCQFFGCYLGFLHGSVPVFPTNTVIISLFHWIPFSGAFCGRTGVFPSAGEFCSKVWRVGHTTRTNNAPARGSDLPKAHSQGPCYCHQMNRTVDVILGLTAAVATALLLALIARDDIGMPPDMVREDALIGASIMIAAVAGIISRKVRQ